MYRVAVHRRRTGRTGLAFVTRPPSGVALVGEATQALAQALVLGAPILDLAGVLEPVGALDSTAVHVAGAVLFAAGLLGTVVSQHSMGAAWRIGVDSSERTALVTDGPFALARHPIFTSLVVLHAGLTLLVPGATALAGTALFAVSVEIQARLVEEPYLQRVHGDRYARYAERVGRFLPRVGRVSPR